VWEVQLERTGLIVETECDNNVPFLNDK